MLPNCPPKMSHFEQQEEVPILTRGLNGFSSASFPEKQWKGLDMLLHGAETLNEIVTVPFNREVLLSDLEGPLANLHWNFYYKDNLSVFSLHPAPPPPSVICLFLLLGCKSLAARDCVWLAHCESQCLLKGSLSLG